LWDVSTGTELHVLKKHFLAVTSVAFSPDGKTLFSAGKEGSIRRIDADSDAILAEWPAHSDWVYALAISPDGSKLASGDWSGAVRLWDVDAGKVVRELLDNRGRYGMRSVTLA
jgi:WD40 repeat protein